MAYYLAKTEPGTYSIGDLQRDQKTTWDGVTNPVAVRAILAMRAGDRVFIYHSGGVSAIVGWVTVTGAGRADAKNPKSAVADFAFGGIVEPAITLAEVKGSGLFSDWALVRQGRLSTMAVPEAFVAWAKKLRPKAGI